MIMEISNGIPQLLDAPIQVNNDGMGGIKIVQGNQVIFADGGSVPELIKLIAIAYGETCSSHIE